MKNLLELKLNNDSMIRKDVAAKLSYYINLEELNRKSRVRFKTRTAVIKDKNKHISKKMKSDVVENLNYKQPDITSRILQVEDFPCTLYINPATNQVMRGHGMNCYNLPFRPQEELNVLSNEPLLVEYKDSVTGKIKQDIITAANIPYRNFVQIGSKLHYIVPFDNTTDILFFTNKARYYHTSKKINGDYPAPLLLKNDEYVSGWETTCLDNIGYIYCLTENGDRFTGVQALPIEEFKRFKGIANLWGNILNITDAIYVEDFEKEIKDLEVLEVGYKDNIKLPKVRILKPRTSCPTRLSGNIARYFARNSNYYYKGLFLSGEALRPIMSEKRTHESKKYHTIDELSPVSRYIVSSSKWEKLLYKYNDRTNESV